MSVETRKVVVTLPEEEETIKQESFFPPPSPEAAVEPARKTTKEMVLQRRTEPLYYNIPMLKPPTWKWQIASYFFLGGLSAGAYLISRAADRFGGEDFKRVTRLGTLIAAGSFVPCTPLLISDLKDPLRFHHMLRIFKPLSPMNLGSWVLTSYGAMLTLASIRELLNHGRFGVLGNVVDGITAYAGAPLAIMMAGYTGNLIATSSNPLWAKNAWLSPLFSASAIYNGVEAIELALDIKPRKVGAGVRINQGIKPIHTISQVARAAEGIGLAGYLATAGKKSKPLTTGKLSPMIWAGAIGAGLVIPQVLDRVSERRSVKSRKVLGITSAVIGMLGSLAMRWAIVYGGHTSAKDPEAARELTKAPGKQAQPADVGRLHGQ